MTDPHKKDSLYVSLKLTSQAIAFLTALTLIFSSLLPVPAWADYGDKLPLPQPSFQGKIGITYKESQPDFPKPIKAPENAPNVLLVLLDDVGFGQTSTFGGLIDTPNLDRLAERGLRYNQFHTTALCSPTRAALLTGRNHHSVSTGVITELATGYPGYTAILPRSAATIAEVLRNYGYNTAAFGKWHNTPDYETSAAGPFDRWPTGLGFEYFYGFLGGDTNQWSPALVENTQHIQKPSDLLKAAALHFVTLRERYRPDYHLTPDLADHAIKWIRTQQGIAPDKPFFTYFATGATHAPHHAPKEWIDKYKGKFDRGWDKLREDIFARQLALGVIPADTKLTPRPVELPAWDSLTPTEQKVYARQAEVFAGFLSHTDAQIGRVIDAIDQLGELDNTLVFASHFGGTRNGLVVAWGDRIKDRGGLRSQFHHVIDIAPTILEAVGIEEPEVVNGAKQQPIEGTSLVYSFDDPAVPSHHKTQYFEMFGNRGIYDQGWVAAARHGRLPWERVSKTTFDEDNWELYDITKDFSEANDLAKQNPAKLAQLQNLFLKEAKKYKVLPLDDRLLQRFDVKTRSNLTTGRNNFTYYTSVAGIPEGSAPNIKNRSFSITADVDVASSDTEGVLVTQGGRFAGWSFFLKEGKPTFAYNFLNSDRTIIQSSQPIAIGKSQIKFDFTYDGGAPGAGGTGKLLINEQQVAEGRIDKTVGYRFGLDETFDVGQDTGTPAVDTYQTPFAFTGNLQQVTLELK